MNKTLSQNLLAGAEQVRIFDLKLVDGHCITPFEIYYITPENRDACVRAIAFPGTERQYSLLIDKADVIDNLVTGVVTGTVWIDIELGEPTPLAASLGAAIEAKCRDRNVSGR